MSDITVLDRQSLEEAFLSLLVVGRLLDSGEWPQSEISPAPHEHGEVLPDAEFLLIAAQPITGMHVGQGMDQLACGLTLNTHRRYAPI